MSKWLNIRTIVALILTFFIIVKILRNFSTSNCRILKCERSEENRTVRIYAFPELSEQLSNFE